MRQFLLALALCASMPLLAQSNYPESHQAAKSSSLGLSVIPAASTAVLAAPAQVPQVQQIFAVNTTASAVTFTVTDGSTNCGGAACMLVPAVTIPANGQYYATFKGIPAVGGIKWSAGTANALQGFIQWVY